MPILTTQFNDLVKNAKVQWRNGFDRVAPAARQLYDVSSVAVMTSEHSQIDGYTFAKRKLEGESYTIGNIKQGYKLNLSQSRIGLMDTVTWEMRKFDKYREIEKKMTKLGEATAQRIELDLTHQFTFGMAGASYTNMDGETVSTATGDGQNIFDTDHTTTGGTTGIANLITTAFSRAGLEEAETLFTKFVDNNGNKVIVQPDTIITTDDPALVNSVKEFLKSTQIPDMANNAVNVYSGKYKHIILPYLATDKDGAYDSTKATYWMLADLGNKDAILEISENPTFKAPSIGGNGEEFETDDWKFKSSATYDYGVLDFKWIVGSTGATS